MAQKRAKVGDKVVLTDPINYGKVVEVTDIDDDGFIVYEFDSLEELLDFTKQKQQEK